MIISQAERFELNALLSLQYQAYRSEAELLNDFSIPPLKETLEELLFQYDRGDTFLKLQTENGLIVGSVRGKWEQGTLFIGKLMVHSEHRNHGYGRRLLKHIQTLFPSARYELFTSNKSLRNIELYEREGFRRFCEKTIRPGLKFIYLEKLPDKTSHSRVNLS